MSILSAFKGKHAINKVGVAGMYLSSNFGINESVYVLFDYKIHTGNIVRVDGSVQLDRSTPQRIILYTIELSDAKETIQLPEDLCFKSKEDLIASLSI